LKKISFVLFVLITSTLFFGVFFVESIVSEKNDLRLAKEYVVKNYEPDLKVKNLWVWRYGDKENPNVEYVYEVKKPHKATNGKQSVEIRDRAFKRHVEAAIEDQDRMLITGGLFFLFAMSLFMFAIYNSGREG